MTAFLLTWKETGWPHENIVTMIRILERDGYVDQLWRIRAHKAAKVGDRVFVLKQGRGPKGVFGVGELSAAPGRHDAGGGKMQPMALMRFDALVDPRQQFLIGEEAVRRILSENQMNAQASGDPLRDEQAAALDQIISSNETVVLGGAGNWTPSELGAIVKDYFQMLQLELTHYPYSKTEHRNALRQEIMRTPSSIERKHQNISAVLRDLKLPWIDGYKPLSNFQDSLVDAIEAQLDAEIDRLDALATTDLTSAIDIESVFVAPPLGDNTGAVRPAIVRIARN